MMNLEILLEIIKSVTEASKGALRTIGYRPYSVMA